VLVYVEINSDGLWKLSENSFRPFDGSDLRPRRPADDPRLDHVGFVTDKEHFDWFFCH